MMTVKYKSSFSRKCKSFQAGKTLVFISLYNVDIFACDFCLSGALWIYTYVYIHIFSFDIELCLWNSFN